MNVFNKYIDVITSDIIECLKLEYYLNIEERMIKSKIVKPNNYENGDLSIHMGFLSKEISISPQIIAKNIGERLMKLKKKYMINIINTYINFTLENNDIVDIITMINDCNFCDKIYLGMPQTIMIEFSQPNTHKIFHVGHVRNLALGNSLVKFYQQLGHDVIATNYYGDEGIHIARCLWSILKKKIIINKITDSKERNNILAECYIDGVKNGDKASYEINEILKKLENNDHEIMKIWKETRKWSLDDFKNIYKWFDCEFNKEYFEHDVGQPSIKLVKDLFKDGKLDKSNETLGKDLSDYGLGYCMLLKSNGSGLYATKDILLAMKKFEDYKLDKSLYIVDSSQSLHFQQIFKTLELLDFKHHNKCNHIPYNQVMTPEGRMKSREGNVVSFCELAKLLEKYPIEISNSIIKYGMLKKSINKNIIFDLPDWSSVTGDTGPYIMYAFARIKGILSKCTINDKPDWTLINKIERNIIMMMYEFWPVIHKVIENNDPSYMCEFLFNLAKHFNIWYEDKENNIINCDNKCAQTNKLLLITSVSKILGKGLELLGIMTLDKIDKIV